MQMVADEVFCSLPTMTANRGVPLLQVGKRNIARSRGNETQTISREGTREQFQAIRAGLASDWRGELREDEYYPSARLRFGKPE